MQSKKMVYINGYPIIDTYEGLWTPDIVDKVYEFLTMSGLIPKIGNVPEWYPANIVGYSNYSASKDGRLRPNNGNQSHDQETRGSPNRDALKFSLVDPVTKDRKQIQAHILIAKMFLPMPAGNPENYFVHHRDGNKKNNHVENLEWRNKYLNIDTSNDIPLPMHISVKEEESTFGKSDPGDAIVQLDMAYKEYKRIPRKANPGHRPKNRYALRQLEPDTRRLIKIWSSVKEAGTALGLKRADRSNISRAVKNKSTAVGFLWEYSTDSIEGEEWKPSNRYPSLQVSDMGRLKDSQNEKHKDHPTIGYVGDYGYNLYAVEVETTFCVRNIETGEFEFFPIRKKEIKRIDQLVRETFHYALPCRTFLIYHRDDNVANDKFSNLDLELECTIRDRFVTDVPRNQYIIWREQELDSYLEFD